MIKKDRLIRLLRNASDLEEDYTEFLTGYTEKYFDWTGYDPVKVSEAKKILDRLRTDSERHRKMLEDILTWIAERRENGF
jgi:rubrerythrin